MVIQISRKVVTYAKTWQIIFKFQFEAVDSLRGILGESDVTRELYKGFRGQLMDSWGEHGLRFHKKHPWTHTIHSSFHEMGYILPALNRLGKWLDDMEERRLHRRRESDAAYREEKRLKKERKKKK